MVNYVEMLSGGSGNYNDKEKRSGTYKIGMIVYIVYFLCLLDYTLIVCALS